MSEPYVMLEEEGRTPPPQDGLLCWLTRPRLPSETVCWHRFFGVLQLALIALLFLSGLLMAFSYTPVPGTAYDSVDYFQFSLPFGDIVRGVHHYAWNSLLIVMGLHLLRAFVVGAYKPPRHPVWLSGLLFLLLMPLFIITGDLLPWDQKGYWSTQVRFSIISSIPGLGDFMVQMLRGGGLTGIVTLTRFYVLHVLLLPAVLLGILALHLCLLARHGLSPPMDGQAPARPPIPLLPSGLNRFLLLLLAAMIALAAAAYFHPAPLGDPADPSDTSFVPRPEWWVLFLNQLVSIFKGPFTVVGSAVIPGGLILLLAALPWLDRSPDRRPSRRIGVLAAALVVLIAITVLSVMGYIEHFVRPEH